MRRICRLATATVSIYHSSYTHSAIARSCSSSTTAFTSRDGFITNFMYPSIANRVCVEWPRGRGAEGARARIATGHWLS